MTNLSGIIGVVFVLYLLVMVLIGFVSARTTHSSLDFFLGRRSLKAWVTAISSTASSESAWAVLGTVGLTYKEGLSAAWFLPGCLFGYTINWFFLAERLRRHSREHHSITIPDYLASHFDSDTRLLRLIAVAIIFTCMMAYMAAQFTAIGKTFDSIFGIPHSVSIPIGAFIILLYTAMGGFLAVVWTDFIQGLIMVGGLFLLAVAALIELGGWGGMIENVQQAAPEVLTWTGGKTRTAFLGAAVGLLGIGLGYPGQPHVLNRYMAARDDRAIRQGVWIAMGWGFLTYTSAIVLGIAGRALIPSLGDPEHLFPRAAEMLLPTILAAVVLTGILAAIMSTISAQILVATSAVAHDVLHRLLKRNLSQEKVLFLSRLALVILGLGAMAIALTQVEVIFWFVLFAWSGLGASFGPLILWTLYAKTITQAAAIAGMVTGFSTTVIWKVSGLSDTVIYELVPAFLFSFIAIWGATKASATRQYDKV
ncbi:MAG: sodium/proline symporter [Pseudomonadota bacterium]